MATLELNGKTLATQTSTAEPVIGSNVVFPAGHIVSQSHTGNVTANASAIAVTSTSFADTAIEISHTTKLSSADSYLVYEFYSGMFFLNASQTHILDVTMRTVSNATYTAAETIIPAANKVYFYQNNQFYRPLSVRLFCGLVTNMGMPSTKSSWASGDALKFRLFAKGSAGATTIVHAGANWNATVKEVAR